MADTRTTRNDHTDLDVKLESSQQTIRAEATPAGEREERSWTHGETRVTLHAVTEANRRAKGAAQQVVRCLADLSSARANAEVWLATLGDREAGTWRRDRDALSAHHQRATSGDGGDGVLLSRQPWLGDGTYVALLGVLVLADFMFFLTLWRDIEEAEGWFSVATLQAALYGLITPVASAVVMKLLGRTVASRIHQGASASAADRGRLWATVLVAGIAVLVILAAVRQRLTVLRSVEGGLDLFEPLFFLLFLLLPLALGLAEAFRHDEDVAVDRLRTANGEVAGAYVTAVYAEGKAAWNTWNGAYLQGVQLIRTLEIDLQEPLYAAADLISQERAHSGTDGDFATLCWPDTEDMHDGGDADRRRSDSLDPVLAGPAPRVRDDLLHDLRSGLTADRPVAIDAWLRRTMTALNGGPVGGDQGEGDGSADGGTRGDDEEVASLAVVPAPGTGAGGEA